MAAFVSLCFALCVVLSGAETRVSMPPDSFRHPVETGEWEDVGEASETDVLRLTFALRQNPQGLQELKDAFRRVSDPEHASYGRFLQKSDVDELVQPSAEAYEAVEGFLTEHEVLRFGRTGNGDYITVDADAKTAGRMLAADFRRYQHTGRGLKMVRTADHHYSLPESVAQHVDFVAGVSGMPFTMRTRTYEKESAAPRRLDADGADIPAGSSPLAVLPTSWRGGVVSAFAMLRCLDGSPASTTGVCGDGNDVKHVTVAVEPLDYKTGEAGPKYVVSQGNLMTYCQPCDKWTNPTVYRGRNMQTTCDLLDHNKAFASSDMTFSGCWFSLMHAPLGANSTFSIEVSYTNGQKSDAAACPEGLRSDYCGPYISPQPDVTPQFMQARYGIPPGTVGGGGENGNRQAVAEFLEEYYNTVDLTGYLQMYQVPEMSRSYELVCGGEFSLVQVNETTGEKTYQQTMCNDPGNPGGEATLDLQVMLGVAPNVPLEFWSFGGRRDDTSEPSDFNQEPFLTYMQTLNSASDNQATGLIDAPWVHSFSYDDQEDQMPLEYMNRCDVEFQKAGLRGVSLFFASGDDGAGGSAVRNYAEDPSTCERFHANWPSSSPYITSVGGTATGRDQYGQEEEIVSSAEAGARITTGGGFSDGHYGVAWYQKDHVAQYFDYAENLPPSSMYNSSGRGYPDLSAIATNFMIVLGKNGQGPSPIGGTSASTPLVAAIFSLINERRVDYGIAPLGFVNPVLYTLSSNCSSCFSDVVTGNNRCSANPPPSCCDAGFEAAEGWDPTTGLGTPRYLSIARELTPPWGPEDDDYIPKEDDDEAPPDHHSSSSSQDDGLTGGEIAAAVIGSLVGAGMLAGGAYFGYVKYQEYQSNRAGPTYHEFENANAQRSLIGSSWT